jgi:hypothetical protein
MARACAPSHTAAGFTTQFTCFTGTEWRALARHRAQQQVLLLNLLALLVQKYKHRRSCGKKRSSSDAAQLCTSRFTGFTGKKYKH